MSVIRQETKATARTLPTWRKYCKKCGLTWFAKSASERCPDCPPVKEPK